MNWSFEICYIQELIGLYGWNSKQLIGIAWRGSADSEDPLEVCIFGNLDAKMKCILCTWKETVDSALCLFFFFLFQF